MLPGLHHQPDVKSRSSARPARVPQTMGRTGSTCGTCQKYNHSSRFFSMCLDTTCCCTAQCVYSGNDSPLELICSDLYHRRSPTTPQFNSATGGNDGLSLIVSQTDEFVERATPARHGLGSSYRHCVNWISSDTDNAPHVLPFWRSD